MNLKDDVNENNIKKDYIEEVDFINAARKNIIRYSVETFVRAFPDSRDGLKPIHRRILYTMFKDKIFSATKVAKITGNVMGNFHPHGDSSISDALVRMGQPWVMNYPYILGQGNYGLQDGDSAAASRYIEASLTDFAKKVIIDDIDNVSVNYEPNYDYTTTIPEYLSTRIPLVLINGAKGIGEAYSTNIPPHNLNDIADICISYIKNKNISNEVLCDGLFPDFPTGGEIINGRLVEKFYKYKEKTTIKLRGKSKLLSDTNTIVIKEFPYGIAIDSITMAIREEVKKGNMILSGIEAIQDNNGNSNNDDITKVKKNKKQKKSFEYVCKKDASMMEILNEMYRVTGLSTSIPLSFLVYNPDTRLPEEMDVKQIVEKWYEVRYDIKRRRHTNNIAQLQSRFHILKGIKKVYNRIDNVIDTIRHNSDNKDTLIRILHDKFDLSVVQAKGIYEMNLGSLSKFGEDDLDNQINKISSDVEYNEKCLNDIDNIIISELTELKDLFGRPRQTLVTMDIEEYINSKPVITKGSFIYAYNAIGLYDANGVKDSKNILTGLKSVKIVNRNVREIIGGCSLKGTPIAFIIFYNNGCANRIESDVFRVLNVWYCLNQDNDTLITSATPIYSDDDILTCVSSDNKIKRIASSDISSKRMVTVGSIVKSVISYNEETDKDYENVLMACENGSYALLQLDDIPLLNRNASGVKSPFSDLENSFKIFMNILPSNPYENERLLCTMTDTKDDQNYVYNIPVCDLKLINRSNVPKMLAIQENCLVTSINDIDVSDKESQLFMIGKTSSSSLAITNFKKPFDIKRVFISITSSTQL